MPVLGFFLAKHKKTDMPNIVLCETVVVDKITQREWIGEQEQVEDKAKTNKPTGCWSMLMRVRFSATLWHRATHDDVPRERNKNQQQHFCMKKSRGTEKNTFLVD